MLLSITEKCRMNCPHCLDDAQENSTKIMDFKTFKRSLQFIAKHDNFVMITGGEPTEHPQFWNYLEYVTKKFKNDFIITVATNGMNLDKDDGILYYKIKSLSEIAPISFQVTCDKRYYTKYIIDKSNKIFSLPNVVLVDNIGDKIYPQGRALKNNYDYFVKAPKCFNFRSAIRTCKDIDIAISTLRSRGYYCTPQISYDGYIRCGESTLCPKVAHICDHDYLEKIINFKCDGCKIAKSKLSQYQLNFIGE